MLAIICRKWRKRILLSLYIPSLFEKISIANHSRNCHSGALEIIYSEFQIP